MFFLLSIIISVILSNTTLSLDENTYSLIVSKNEGLLKLIKKEKETYKTIKEISVAIGLSEGDKVKEGDKKTPTGIYFSTRRIEREDIPSEEYGARAFILNYPNIIDEVFLNKGGSGIWLHGTDEKIIKKNLSRGCIVMSNKDIIFISNYIISNKTPIIILDSFKDIEYKNISKNLIIFKNSDIFYEVFFNIKEDNNFVVKYKKKKLYL
jgi:murein L,D-transpeptidase YafK